MKLVYYVGANDTAADGDPFADYIFRAEDSGEIGPSEMIVSSGPWLTYRDAKRAHIESLKDTIHALRRQLAHIRSQKAASVPVIDDDE